MINREAADLAGRKSNDNLKGSLFNFFLRKSSQKKMLLARK